MTLFGDWLAKTQSFQREVYGYDLTKMTDEEQRRYLHEMTFAAAAELFELSAEYSWKSWATVQPTNRSAVIGEAVDVLFFVGNLLSAVGCTDEELNERYEQKRQINRERQERTEGYSTVEGKCPICRRALDDPAVNCTAERCISV